MSRPQKIIPPVKGNFIDIINNVADGRGVKKQDTRSAANERMMRSTPKQPPKKP
jgi:hypothetical protein